MSPRSFCVAPNVISIAPRTMADVTIATRVHVAIECWLEDHNLFQDDDTATLLAGFVMRRASEGVS